MIFLYKNIKFSEKFTLNYNIIQTFYENFEKFLKNVLTILKKYCKI